MRSLLHAALAALILFGTPVGVSAAPDEQSFSEAALARVRDIVPDRTYRLKPDEPLVIQVAGDDGAWSQTINLHRIHGYCRTVEAADCDKARDDFLRRIAIKPLAPARDRLRVIVRDTGYVDAIRQAMGAGGRRIFARPIGDDLHTLLAFDSPETIAIATDEQLSEIGLSEEAAWPLALTQTLEMLPAIPIGAIARREPVSVEHSEYLATLIADLAEWKDLAKKGGPDMYVTVATDDFVYIGFLPDGRDLDVFAQAVRDDCAGALRCVSPHVYRFRKGRWAAVR